MCRLGQTKWLAVLGSALLLALAAAPVRADGLDEAREPQLAGLVYRVRPLGDQTRLTVYVLDIRHAVDVYVRDPALLTLVARDVCPNRYVTVVGERIDLDTMAAQGLEVDTSRPCGKPPR